MIDYEKLKIAHEMAEKLSQQEPFVSFCYDFFYCKKEGNRFQVKLLLGPERREFQSGYYDMRNLDDLISKLQELLEYDNPKPNYKINDKAWTLIGQQNPVEVILSSKEVNGDSWWVHVEGLLCGFSVAQENLYKSKCDLIESQLDYWKNQLSEELEQDVSPYYSPPFEGEITGFNNPDVKADYWRLNYLWSHHDKQIDENIDVRKSLDAIHERLDKLEDNINRCHPKYDIYRCEHENDGLCHNITYGPDCTNWNSKCKKCGEFYR